MTKVGPQGLSLAAMLALSSAAGRAQFVPPAGYSGGATRPGVAVPTDPDAPRLTRVPDASLAELFRVDPEYRRDTATGHVEVVGAFEVAEAGRRRLTAAWSPGFLPVTLSFGDGTCYSLEADYTGGTLSDGRLVRAKCDARRDLGAVPPPPPAGRPLRLIGSAWGYAAWADAQAGSTVVTAPDAKSFQPLFTARMTTTAIAAMNGPDYPGGNVTLVGRINGRLTVVTLEVGY